MDSQRTNLASADLPGTDTWQEVLGEVSPEHQFLSHHWYDVWGRTYAANDGEMSPMVFSTPAAQTGPLEEKNSIFPCISRSRYGIQILSMAGYYYPFRTFLFHPDVKDRAIERFAKSVHEQGSASIVNLGPIQMSDGLGVALRHSFGQLRWHVCEVSAGAQQVIELPDSIEKFRASLSRNLRRNHDRRKRALESMGQLDIAHYSSCSAEQWNQVVDQCSSIEARSWLASDDNGKTRIYGREDFWKSYLAAEDGSRRMSISLVSLDSNPIAYSLAIDSGSCRYSISGQYDEAYKKYGVGIIADMQMFVNAIENGFKVVNMGDGEGEYKQRWGAQPGSELQSFYLFRAGISGWFMYKLFRTLNQLRDSTLLHKLNRYF
ncbi:hypothetical protein AB833_02075 [Chromatiales bacterium (ex Bugula neritina AB1)]|nr:hypothetical protein AB833_02075 [Chromatiales bacterium (ex Bugula neritina AB1)]